MNNSTLRDVVTTTLNPEPLPITIDDVDLALLALHHYPVRIASDALLVMCAANLLNAAVKQKGLPVPGGYGFKGRVSDLVETWCAHPIEGVDIQAYKDVCYVEIDTIQFSFHHLAAQDRIQCRATTEPWRGVRLQPLSKRLWDAAFAQIEVSEALMQARFHVLGQPIPYAIVQVLSTISSEEDGYAHLAWPKADVEAGIQQLRQVDLVVELHSNHQLRINRWTMALLERTLNTWGQRKEYHATTR